MYEGDNFIDYMSKILNQIRRKITMQHKMTLFSDKINDNQKMENILTRELSRRENVIPTGSCAYSLLLPTTVFSYKSFYTIRNTFFRDQG